MASPQGAVGFQPPHGSRNEQHLQNSYGPELAAWERSPNHGAQAFNSHDTGLHAAYPSPQPGSEGPEVYYDKPAQHGFCTSGLELQMQQGQAPPSQYPENGNGQPPQQVDRAPEKTKVLGLPVALFWILVTAIVLAAVGLGAGLGVGLKGSDRNNSEAAAAAATNPDSQVQTATSSASTAATTATSSSTTSPPAQQDATTTPSPTTSAAGETTTGTATSTSYVTSGTVGLSANSCTFTTPRTHVMPDGTSFTQYCFTDWPNGVAASDGRGNVTDLSRATVYTFEDCMDKCVQYNSRLASGATTRCQAVTYNSNLTSIIAVGRQGGNCFLKDKKGVDNPGRAESACAALV